MANVALRTRANFEIASIKRVSASSMLVQKLFARVICELESDSRGTFERCFVILFKLGQRKHTQVDSVLDESDIPYGRTNS